MDPAPLVIDEIEAGEELLRKLNAYRPVKAACWVRAADHGERYLYVALEGLTDENTDVAYGEVLQIARGMKDRFIDPFRVKLVPPDDPVARSALDVYGRFPGPIPTRYNGSVFGGMAVSEVYLYPPIR